MINKDFDNWPDSLPIKVYSVNPFVAYMDEHDMDLSDMQGYLGKQLEKVLDSIAICYFRYYAKYKCENEFQD